MGILFHALCVELSAWCVAQPIVDASISELSHMILKGGGANKLSVKSTDPWF